MTTTTYLSCAETAKLVRQALKAAFPGQRFSVRSDVYSGGASIRVRWTDGPRESDVDPVVKAFAGSRFDGMIDLAYGAAHALSPDGEVMLLGTYGHSFGNEPLAEVPDGWTPVRFGADYVFADRDLSPAYAATLRVEAEKVLARNADLDGLSMDDAYWPYTPVWVPGADQSWPVGGPDSLIRVMSTVIRPDGTPFPTEGDE